MLENLTLEERVCRYVDEPSYRRYVAKICYQYLILRPAEIEDVVLEVLLKVWKARFQFRPQSLPQTEAEWDAAYRKWLAQVTRNHCLDVLRQPYRPTIALEELGELPFDPLADFVESQVLKDCLERLQASDAIAFETVVAKHLEGLVWEELAQVQGMSVSQARTRVERGTRALQGCLEGR